MNALEQDILDTLRQLEAVARRPAAAGPKPELGPLLTRLDSLEQRLPAETDPGLRHYLQRKSYEKARLWLEGREAENVRGGCRPPPATG